MNTHTWSLSPATGWFKSSFSNPSQDCVEVKLEGDVVRLRDSKDQGTGPVITVPAQHWPGFIAEALGRDEAGSNRAVRIHPAADGSVRLYALDCDVTLGYTSSEWEAFVAGAQAGQFDHSRATPSDALTSI
ncbi:DUF397 domain-containing protein [Amycolatopsis sp. K13G38]|uniref:DUF397 domain-containing protein n=1 Tax=Amycolatopsis acididurans TaxID=2724524 RepID=A0ABX1J788_9PSEU|nr:DUF397 domain-containing protein [Amycolatopsis acididurans]NKQ55613.1 DUF397 domain-containing protein [Amycolatopsis acididurans]